MKHTILINVLLSALLLAASGPSNTVMAHSFDGIVLDAGGNNPSATDLASVTCFDDSSGAPHHLAVQIRDSSTPVDGLLLSVHIYKGTQMTSITDTSPGDENYSPLIHLNGGAGNYILSTTKTDAGPRFFDIIWHCETADNIHTGTDITVFQVQ